MSSHLRNGPMRGRTQSRVAASEAHPRRQLLTLALALLGAALLLLGRPASGAPLVVNVAPPPLPVYEQPAIPAANYLWQPGYWSYGPEGYYWVPGTWVLAPDPDLVWTPGYWSWSDGGYLWNPGYWAPQVGFYGGIDYGFGYFGHGYDGGYWRDHHFWYNRSVNNLGSANVTNVYSQTVNNVTVSSISYNGGPGGVDARPTPDEQAAARQPRHAPTREQVAHAAAASRQHELLASVNQGHPPIAATAQPGAFSGAGVEPARSAGRSGNVRGAPSGGAHSGHASESPRRLAEAPPQTAPPSTHEQAGPAARSTPPPQHAQHAPPQEPPRPQGPEHPQ